MKSLKLLSLLTLVLGHEAMGKVSYKVQVGECPTHPVTKLAATLAKEYENGESLLDLKKKILSDNLQEKFYLSSYDISLDPRKSRLTFEFNCPKPLLKVSVLRKDQQNEVTTAILTADGKLFDPTYEAFLREDKKLPYALPNLAVPYTEVEKFSWTGLAKVMGDQREEFRRKFSELILNSNGELTLILSLDERPSSVFFGDNEWEEKFKKLEKIVNYFEKKNKIPAVVNLKNSKKVVVKF